MSSKIKIGVWVAVTGALAAIVLWQNPARLLPPPPVLIPATTPSPDAKANSQPEENSLSGRLRARAEAANAAPEEQRDAAWKQLVDSVPLADIPEMLKALASASDEASVQFRQLLIRRWAASDPAAAAGWVVRFAPSAIQPELLQQVAVAWSQSNMTQAIQWAQTLPDGLRADVCLTLAYEAARTDPKTALTLAGDLPANQADNDLIMHAVAQWAIGDPAAAADWAKQITDPGLRDEALSAIATEWGTKDPVAAATLALKSIEPGKLQDDAIVGIVQRWAQTDPQAAASWVASFPEGNLQLTAMENLVKPWALANADAVGQWLNTLPSGSLRDAAVADYVTAITPRSPAQAADWAKSISETTLQNRELENVINAWMAQDASSAKNWLAKNEQKSSGK